MKALIMRAHGDLSQLAVTDVPEPQIQHPQHVRVRIQAAALNHLDLWTLAGLPGLSLKFPHILAGDGAGLVESVGPDVQTVKPGDRVLINPGISCYRCEFCLAGEHSLCIEYQILGEHLPGTAAELAVVPEHNVAVIPVPASPHAEISWPEAAAFSLVTLTAWRMVITRARLRPGETVLIWGIGGGVSLAALQVAKLAGGYVIATSSNDAKLARARSLGADITLNHRQVDVAKEVRKLTRRRGVDVVVDNVGSETWEQTLRALGRGGRVVTCGGTTGHELVTDVRRLFWYQWDILGSTMGSHAEFREIVRLLGQGKLRPQVDSVVPLAEAVKAFQRLQEGAQFGKLVVTP